jgi:pyruvate/2-oxoacid:ferredoxin oxidoreductase alpha subunit
MEAANSLKLAMQAIKQAVGQEVPVVCIVVDARGGPVQRDEDIDADGMVNEALNLGAKIVHKE